MLCNHAYAKRCYNPPMNDASRVQVLQSYKTYTGKISHGKASQGTFVKGVDRVLMNLQTLALAPHS